MYKTTKFWYREIASITSFSDASADGYAQVSYLRLENEQGEIYVSFPMGKSRVAPVKSVTIPRLELTTATTSVKVRNMLVKELDYQQEEDVCWTDSTTVLQYINDETKRFTVFVANRVQTIREVRIPPSGIILRARIIPLMMHPEV